MIGGEGAIRGVERGERAGNIKKTHIVLMCEILFKNKSQKKILNVNLRVAQFFPVTVSF